MTRRKTQLKTYGTKKYTKTKREKKKNIVPNQEKKTKHFNRINCLIDLERSRRRCCCYC